MTSRELTVQAGASAAQHWGNRGARVSVPAGSVRRVNAETHLTLSRLAERPGSGKGPSLPPSCGRERQGREGTRG